MYIDFGKPLLFFIVLFVAYWIIPYYNYQKELYHALCECTEEPVEEESEEDSKNN